MRPYRRFTIAALWVPAFLAAFADAPPPPPTRPPWSIHRAASAVRVDGVLDEAAWSDALRFEVSYEWFPGDNVPPPVRTEFLASYDDRNLYVAWICSDPRPSEIRAHFMDRDQVDTFVQDDHVVLMIDPFNDERRGFQFRVNPLGVQMDAIFSENEGVEDFSYDMIWASAGKITADGYVVEVAIPLNQIRFPKSTGPQTWGFDVGRSYPRSVRHRVTAHPIDRNKSCVLCQVDKVNGFENIQPGRNLDFAPTFTLSRTDGLPGEATLGDGLATGPAKGDLGATLRWGITQSLTFNGTVNPDFSQVEADAAQLTVNQRFALFYPEKRPFFLEGTDLFTTPLQAVFTRTVVDPDWGAKLTGKLGRDAVGVFVTRDTVNNLVLPANQYSAQVQLAEMVTGSVVRYRRDVGAGSSLGFLYTGRESSDYHNRLAGIDGVIRAGDSDRIYLQYLRTDTAYPRALTDPASAPPDSPLLGQPSGSFGGNGAYLEWLHQSRKWFWDVTYKDLGADFRADSGFIPRVDVRDARGRMGYTIWGTEKSWYSRINLGGGGRRIENHDGLLTDATVEFFANVQGPLQSVIEVFGSTNKEYFQPGAPDTGILHAPLNRGGFDFSVQPAGWVRLDGYAEFGGVVDYASNTDASQVFLNPRAELKLGRHVNAQLDHQYQRLKSQADGTELFTVNLSQLRLVYNINLRAFVRGIFQYQDLATPPQPDAAGRQLFYQLLFAYKLNPQAVVFVGYTNTEVGTSSVALSPTERTFFMKLGYVWAL